MKRRAFSLTELLTVILIIVIVASLLFPAFTSAKGSASKTVCISNIRQIFTAVSLYENEFGEYPPRTLNWPGLSQYNVNKLACPVATKNRTPGFDYLLYDFVDPNGRTPEDKLLYQQWHDCLLIRGPAMPIIFDFNHESAEQAYATRQSFVLLGRFDGSIARIDSKFANSQRIAGNLPCKDAPILEMNF